MIHRGFRARLLHENSFPPRAIVNFHELRYLRQAEVVARIPHQLDQLVIGKDQIRFG